MKIWDKVINKFKSRMCDDTMKAAENTVLSENAVITYILLQSKDNNISLAQKDDVAYVSFRNAAISNFLKEWYTVLQMYQHKRLSESTYELLVNTKLEENK